MPANLDQTTGAPAFAYVGKRAWHGLGTMLPEGGSIDVWRKAARLEWNLERLPVQYLFDGKTRAIPERFALVRSDSGEALSIVSGGYNVFQPKDVLEFYKDLVQEYGYALETAGSLDGGRKFWALARTGRRRRIYDDDEIEAYLLLATSCDKSLATTAAFTSVRVVCQNTLSFAIKDIKSGRRPYVKVPHHRQFDAQAVKDELGLLDEAWDGFLSKVIKMASFPMQSEDAFQFFGDLLLQKGKKTLAIKAARDQQSLMALYKSAPGQDLPTAKGTLWGAVNAVTYFVDHVRSSASGDRLDDSWFGAGRALKDKAWEAASVFVSR